MSQSEGSTEFLPRYVVGIDLGTTNCAAAFVDAHDDPWVVKTLDIPQWVAWGQIEYRTTLPSFHFELNPDAVSSIEAGLPWENPKKTLSPKAESPFVVGALARDAGMFNPGRRIASAKSWLSHDGVDRSAELLPWHGDSDVARLSPVEVSARYLMHLRCAWDVRFPDYPLAQQDVVITLPASFDEVARELTIQAAKRAGLPRVFLIEEPQAAFYAWIDRHRDSWFHSVGAGQMILVCDIGGGTSDFTLIRVRPAGNDSNQVQFHRVAVGQHLILGGDNLDLALASFAESTLGPNQRLPPRDWDRLIQASRVAKETMLADGAPDNYTIHLSNEGARLIAGSRTINISYGDIQKVLVDGFFPIVPRNATPQRGESGFREFGLPFASDPAVTRHLAAFLTTHARAGIDASDTSAAIRPDLVLFNGGVMAAPVLRNRILDSISSWFGETDGWKPTMLDADHLDLAVAQGAAYYGMVRRGCGVRIAANLGRSYYVQVADTSPETMCLIPGRAEAGQIFSPSHRLHLELGAPVQFPLWVSSTRLADNAGDLVALERQELSPLPPIRTVLSRGRKKTQQSIEVRIETELSEIGTLGLFCVDVETTQRWKLEFDIRATLETDREVHTGQGESKGIVDSDTLAKCRSVIEAHFNTVHSTTTNKRTMPPPGNVYKQLRAASGIDRSDFPPSLLRDLWSLLVSNAAGRKVSASHEARWLNLVGYCLRPGYGLAVDDWRVSEIWRLVHGKLVFGAATCRTESLILWRRIAGGLTAMQQQQLITPVLATLLGRGARFEPHEVSELWRLAGSLEWLPAETKLRLAVSALDEAEKRKSDGFRDALVWAAGRLCTRRPLYGPLNTIVPPDNAWLVLQRLMAANFCVPELGLAVMQIGQKTDDRYRDLPEVSRTAVANWLQQQGAPERFSQAVLLGGVGSGEDDAAMFGESLPLGIRLIR